MYTIGICDDCKIHIRKLKSYIKEAVNCPKDLIIYEYFDGLQLLNDIGREHNLLFIDMQMPGIDGIETAKRIRKENSSAIVVFCSGVIMPTPEAFKVQAFRYLLKQTNKGEIKKELKVILDEMIKKSQVKLLAVKYNGAIIRINVEEIIYATIYRKQSRLFITNREKMRMGFCGNNNDDGIICMKKLDDLKTELEGFWFSLAHKSYLVNLRYIQRKDKDRIELVDNIVLNCSRSKSKEFTKDFLRYLNETN